LLFFCSFSSSYFPDPFIEVSCKLAYHVAGSCDAFMLGVGGWRSTFRVTGSFSEQRCGHRAPLQPGRQGGALPVQGGRPFALRRPPRVTPLGSARAVGRGRGGGGSPARPHPGQRANGKAR
jgi:hypothetical protein